jgi:hypothetical protein
MELLIVVLNEEEYLERILSILVELEVSEATVLDSESLGQFLAYEVPIFAGLQQLKGRGRTTSRTILALIKKRNFFPGFKELLAEENIDFTQPGMGIIATLPVGDVIMAEDEIP